jgi:arylformamidase
VRLYDISLPVDARTAVWPGDTPFHLQWNCRLEEGESVNLSTVTLSVHTGSHADAPLHFDPRGAGIGELDLSPYLGLARLVDVSGRQTIEIADLEHLDLARAPRLLLRTGAWPDPSRFPEQIPVMAPDVPDWLGDRGVVLLGLDVPSVDTLDSRDLPNHHALNRRGIRILESLRLDGVPEGEYELIALPLRLAGADGSPVRAVLRAE